MEKTTDTIGARIRAARLAKGQQMHAALIAQGIDPRALKPSDTIYGQAALAADAGCRQAQVSAWEQGDICPSVGNLMDIARALGLRVDDLLPPAAG